jgi:hypothetical protein
MFLEGEEETEHGENDADLRCRVSNSPICGDRRQRAWSGCVISIDESCRRLNRTKKRKRTMTLYLSYLHVHVLVNKQYSVIILFALLYVCMFVHILFTTFYSAIILFALLYVYMENYDFLQIQDMVVHAY